MLLEGFPFFSREAFSRVSARDAGKERYENYLRALFTGPVEIVSGRRSPKDPSGRSPKPDEFAH